MHTVIMTKLQGFCQLLKPPCVDIILNRNYNISISRPANCFVFTAAETDQFVSVEECPARSSIIEGDFVTTLHFIASNDQPGRQTWITSFPSYLSDPAGSPIFLIYTS